MTKYDQIINLLTRCWPYCGEGDRPAYFALQHSSHHEQCSILFYFFWLGLVQRIVNLLADLKCNL